MIKGPLFPNIDLDLSESGEKFLSEDNLAIFDGLCQVLQQHAQIEQEIFSRKVAIDDYKQAHSLPSHQAIPEEMTLFDEFREQVRPLAESYLTEKCLSRGYSGSFGSPGAYYFVNEACLAKFIMKSKTKLTVEFYYGNDFWYQKQFILKILDQDWKIDKIYRYGSDDTWHIYRF